jgi:hypothetical protein
MSRGAGAGGGHAQQALIAALILVGCSDGIKEVKATIGNFNNPLVPFANGARCGDDPASTTLRVTIVCAKR